VFDRIQNIVVHPNNLIQHHKFAGTLFQLFFFAWAMFIGLAKWSMYRPYTGGNGGLTTNVIYTYTMYIYIYIYILYIYIVYIYNDIHYCILYTHHLANQTKGIQFLLPVLLGFSESQTNKSQKKQGNSVPNSPVDSPMSGEFDGASRCDGFCLDTHFSRCVVVRFRGHHQVVWLVVWSPGCWSPLT